MVSWQIRLRTSTKYFAYDVTSLLQQTQTPTPVKRQARARKVFGIAMFEEPESSLSYSPSPGLSTTKKDDTDDSIRSSDPTPMVLFTADQNSETTEQDGSRSLVEKENVPESKSYDKSNDQISQVVSFAPEKGRPVKSIRQQEMNRLRAAAAQSPLKRDFVKKTQNAINVASATINRSLLKPSKSKMKNNRPADAKKVRFQWKEECEEAKSFNEAAEDSRRQFLNLKRDLSSQHFKMKAREDQERKKKHIQQIDKESQFNSEVFRDHQEKLKAERENNRRLSVEARAKLRENNKEGEERLKMIRIEEEAAIFEARYDTSIAHRETQKQNAAQRRKSFVFRGGDARRIRELRATWKSTQLEQEHANFELDQQAARDAEDYKKRMEQARRESLASRNSNARRVRQEEEKERLCTMAVEHDSYELKRAGERDAETYRKKMEDERRKSLAGRNKESARHAEVMKEIRALAHEKQTESFVLKWAGENDAKEYIAKMAEDRRKSLQFRGEEKRRHAMHDADLKAKQLNEAAAEGALQSACEYNRHAIIFVLSIFYFFTQKTFKLLFNLRFMDFTHL